MAEKYDLAVVGLGYAGLPLVIAAARNGMRVAGYDVDASRVAALAGGTSYVDDISDREITEALASGFTPSSDPEVIAAADAVTICVPTPLRDSVPNLSAVLDAAHLVAPRLRPGALVVLESTTYPGTTTDVVLPLLEQGSRTVGEDFLLAFSPERIDPGNPAFGLHNTPKVVGGVTARCTEAATALYARMVQKVVTVSTPAAAELTKLLENTYRQVNIALINEIAVYCDGLGVDVWEVVAAAATKPFGFQSFRPGPGVGGHCIPVDPGYLAFSGRASGFPLRLPELAQEVNDRMPAYVVDRITRLLNDRRRSVRGTRVLLLGATYKPDIADDRGSPAVPVAELLLDRGALVRFHDPCLRTLRLHGRSIAGAESLEAAVAEADLVVLLQAHLDYDLAALADTAPLLFDTTGRAVGTRVAHL
ncbi:UDP-N-acetyl-D-glucosamine dehydrogenase [Streptomyces minutiscleroticus]|uniref:UDP-N-acetyl-D-glucosamine dehydrogenase n=1 Tax=Streptomyces minutiscleroticus TaxID=68238 RepID=A0A918P0M2_9ACTN|nr:nucleotide sugar dehydrogenase [Streptomyces minutiscleroticus]GGY11773.1 UDP-N-acetyl-D-glucosamine dehydrogenase [Streptomyces minutiscleroticus]